MSINMDLTLNETRIIGALLEKEITTPEQYPLSINSLMNACNQKSNREPVLRLDESTVQMAVNTLITKHNVSQASGLSGRVVKFKHRFCNTEFSELQLSSQELAIICLLFLRGPQTPGELRTRSNRLSSFNDVSEVETVLQNLIHRENGPLVQKLTREAGKRESRYAHLFSGSIDEEAPHLDQLTHEKPVPIHNNDKERLAHIESQLKHMQEQINHLQDSLNMLMD